MCRSSAAGSARGFTLLEMLIALAIFGLLAIMSYGGLRSVLEQQFRTEAEADYLAELQKAYLIMQRDIEQIVERPVRSEFGDELAPLVGGQALEMTRAGWSNPLSRPRSTLQRVAWSWTDRQLRRYVWLVLDRAQDTLPAQQILMENVEFMRIRYQLAAGVWKEQWPSPIQDQDPKAAPPVLPAAIEISIEHEHYGTLVWLFQL